MASGQWLVAGEVISDQWSVISETNPPAKPVAELSSSSLQPPASSLRSRRDRRGISLTEVLISMFVLMIGLLGVAAMIPAGRHEILEGAKIDHATAVGRAAFRDLKIRGYLNPANWADASSAGAALAMPVYDSTTQRFIAAIAETNTGSFVTPAVAIDPLALTAPIGVGVYNATFPATATTLAMSRIFPDGKVADLTNPAAERAAVDLVFRSDDDLLFTPIRPGQDNPPEQNVFTGAGIQPYSKAGGSIQKRASEGNYSWLATIVTDPTSSALTSQVTVSVAVFYKRELTDPTTNQPERIGSSFGFPGNGLGGGEINFIHQPPPGLQAKALKPGQWVMLAGTITTSGVNRNYYRWYRVVAADTLVGNSQNVTLAGADWNIATGSSTQIWLFDNIVTVYEKNMRLEVE